MPTTRPASAPTPGCRPSDRRAAQQVALRRAASLGIGCVHEMAGPSISGADDLSALLAGSQDQSDWPEVVGYWGELGGIDTALALGAAGAAGDLFCDGAIGSHTAALARPYTDRPDLHPAPRFTAGADRRPRHRLHPGRTAGRIPRHRRRRR